MPDARNGFITAIVGVIYSLLAYYFLKGFVDAGLVDSVWLLVYDLINVLGIFAFVHVTRFWGTGYLLGWWLGFGIMWYAGTVDSLGFAVSSFILMFVLISRIARRIRSDEDD